MYGIGGVFFEASDAEIMGFLSSWSMPDPSNSLSILSDVEIELFLLPRLISIKSSSSFDMKGCLNYKRKKDYCLRIT